jgi:hypothetical protein
MLDYFGVALDGATVERIARENDVWPEAERPLEHIRQVRPGNFRKHLNRESIEALNSEFRDLLATYSYSF